MFCEVALATSYVACWHETDMPDLAMNVGFQGESGSNGDDAKPSRLTRNGHWRLAKIFGWIVLSVFPVSSLGSNTAA
jgi:hypothetical protein